MAYYNYHNRLKQLLNTEEYVCFKEDGKPYEESMIDDLRELEEELRNNGEYRKANIIDLFIRYSTHCKIDKSVINKKLKALNNKTHLLASTSSEFERITQFKIEGAIEILEEILEGKE